jgi:hypothetical protein
MFILPHSVYIIYINKRITKEVPLWQFGNAVNAVRPRKAGADPKNVPTAGRARTISLSRNSWAVKRFRTQYKNHTKYKSYNRSGKKIE